MTVESQETAVLTILERLDAIQYEVQQLRSVVSAIAPATPQPATDVWQLIRARLAAAQPELLTMSEADLRSEFERLSMQAAANLPFHSLEELERDLRGDDYSLARY